MLKKKLSCVALIGFSGLHIFGIPFNISQSREITSLDIAKREPSLLPERDVDKIDEIFWKQSYAPYYTECPKTKLVRTGDNVSIMIKRRMTQANVTGYVRGRNSVYQAEAGKNYF